MTQTKNNFYTVFIIQEILKKILQLIIMPSCPWVCDVTVKKMDNILGCTHEGITQPASEVKAPHQQDVLLVSTSLNKTMEA